MSLSLFLAANYPGGTTTIASNINSTITAIPVATGTGANFPAPAAGQYIVLTLNNAMPNLVNEIVWCTAIVGDILTVLRGQESTVAQSWSVGALITNLWTAGQAETLVQQSQLQAQQTNSGQDAGTVNSPSVTLTPVPASLAALKGSPVRVLGVVATSTGNMTLRVNGLGPAPLVLPGGGQIPAGYIAAGQTFEANFDGSFFELLSIPASFAPSGPAGGSLTGTYPNPTIATNAVVNSMIAQVAAMTIKGNASGSAANVTDIPIPFTLNANGSYTLPGTANNALIVNWGIYPTAITSEGAITVSLSAGFSNATLGAWGCIRNTSSSNAGSTVIQYVSSTASSVTFYAQDQSSSFSDAAGGFYWFALGK